MYPYIRCFCGRSLGHLFRRYKKAREIAYRRTFEKEGIEISPDKLQVADSVRVEVGYLLNALHLYTDCCRARLLTQVEYTDVY